jgi:6-phosphogluconolactonase
MIADLRTFKDDEALSKAAAEIFVDLATLAVSTRGRFLVVLSGGSTPSGLYCLLAKEPYRQKVNWDRTFIFWGDERCVPPDNEGSNYRQAYEALLRHVPILDENIQRIQGELEPMGAANGYAQILKNFAAPNLDWPRFDLVLLGMGTDGHTASLFPGSPVEVASPTLAVTAKYQGRPAQRVTLTPPVFNSARTVLFLVTGEDKAETLRLVLSDGYQPEQYPAQRIRPAVGQVIWLVDDVAGSKLQYKENPLVE